MLAEQAVPTWRPTPRQSAFLASDAYEALYGGAAGGGKTDALVMGALRHIDKPTYNAIIFRRTFPELEGQVIPKAREWYPLCGGRYNAVQHCWYFPSGARIHFGHLQHDADVHRYQGWEFAFVGFDELTHFTEHQYTYLLSRARSAAGIPVRIRAATNPGGVGHEWVMKRWAPWLDRRVEYTGVRAEPGKKLRYANGEDGEVFVDSGALSRVFVPATVQDNPHLIDNDPAYVERLRGLDRVSRMRLLEGDWLTKPAAGAYYQRGWFRFLDARPTNAILRVRRWDFASTENGGDWTIGVLMALMPDRSVVVEDVVRVRQRPAGVEETLLATAILDGPMVHVSYPQDPGQAGKAQVEAFTKKLLGFITSSKPETGDKVTRQSPFSAQCEARNVSLVRGSWNEPFLQTLEGFPEGDHDDDVDAAAGAFTYLAENHNATYIQAVRIMAAQQQKGHAA